MKRVAAALLAIAAGTAASAAEPKLDMLAFFTGKTHAENVMRVVLRKPSKLVVDSIGGKGDRGDFVLIDTVREEGKPVRTRKWVMRPDGPDHFTGSLSDATGPVDVRVSGATATIRYLMTDARLPKMKKSYHSNAVPADDAMMTRAIDQGL